MHELEGLTERCLVIQGIQQGFGDMLPTEDILARSQFLEPLDEPTKQLYSKVLHVR